MGEETKPFGSKRAHFDSSSGLYREMRALASADESCIDLALSNPNAVGLEPDLSEFIEPTGQVTYRPEPRGNLDARQAIADTRGKQLSLGAQDVLITSSTSEAYYYLLLALCDPGDTILVPSPSYPLFQQLAQLASVNTLSYRIAYDGAFHLDLASLPTREQILQEKIRFVVAVSPNNPTGNILRHEELAALRSLELPLIVDEVFRPYRHRKDDSWVDPLRDARSSPLTIVLDGLSKRALSPGLKLGWIIALGKHASELWERLEWVSDTFLSVGAEVQSMLPAIVKNEAAIREQAQTRISRNLESLKRFVEGSPISLLSSDGGWSALLRFSQTKSEKEWWRTLSEAGIWLQPGQLYNLSQEPCFVLSLITPEEDLKQGLSRLKVILSGSEASQ